MQLRNVLEPDVKTAEQHYPEVLESILAYTNFCDEHGDEELRRLLMNLRVMKASLVSLVFTSMATTIPCYH